MQNAAGLVTDFDYDLAGRVTQLATRGPGWTQARVTQQRYDGGGGNLREQTSFFGTTLAVPKFVHATWKEDSVKNPIGSDSDGNWLGGIIIGDYTVPVASRIPDAVLDEIRKNGGMLRLKIRLKDNGIAIGWDIEKAVPIPNLPAGYTGSKRAIEYIMPGGDFREAQIYNGKITDPGWEK